jgi:hypothetical protein
MDWQALCLRGEDAGRAVSRFGAADCEVRGREGMGIVKTIKRGRGLQRNTAGCKHESILLASVVR